MALAQLKPLHAFGINANNSSDCISFVKEDELALCVGKKIGIFKRSTQQMSFIQTNGK